MVIPWTKLILATSPAFAVFKLAGTSALFFLSLSLGQFFLIWSTSPHAKHLLELFKHYPVCLFLQGGHRIYLLILVLFPHWIHILFVVILIVVTTFNCVDLLLLPEVDLSLLFLLLSFFSSGLFCSARISLTTHAIVTVLQESLVFDLQYIRWLQTRMSKWPY